MRKTTAISATLVGLASCGGLGQPTPVVSSFNEASVGIQLDATLMTYATPEVQAAAIEAADAEAANVCRRGPNRRAEYASSRQFSTGQYSAVIERLYLCLS